MKSILVSLLGFSWLCIAFTGFNSHSPTPYILPEIGEIGELNIPLDNPMTEEGVALGRLLFYEELLSSDGSFSCGSCHKQELAFTDGLARAIGYRGDTLDRNTMTLVNLAWQQEFFWDGRVKTLEALIEVPITDPREMGQDTVVLVQLLQNHEHYPRYFGQAFGSETVTFENVSKAIAQFLRTIVSPGIKLPDSLLNIPPDNVSETEFVSSQFYDNTMRAVYFRLADMCGSCHSSQVYGGLSTNFNLVNSADSLLKVPPLLNILLTGPYMHKGQFSSLEEVINHYDQHIEALAYLNRKGNEAPMVSKLSAYDKQYLPEFLTLFVDSNILLNDSYGNPKEAADYEWPAFLH
ncbi:MAG: hypothetical protein GC205_03645 [Bacteroidetes bacterium]|nr:hypothetical protein [Bacteroidota bacterium]